MKFIIGILLCVFVIVACDKETERYLWTKYDSEYALAVAFAAKQCVDESDFFDRLETYGEFSSADYKVGDIYLIEQDTNGTIIKTYVRVQAINANDVQLAFSSSDPDLNKIVTWEESDHDDLQTFLEAALCNPTYDSYFSNISGLSSTREAGWKWFKETIIESDNDDSDDEAEQYSRRYDTHTLELDLPSLLYFHNATKVLKQDADSDEDDENTTTSTIEVTQLTDDEIDDDCSITNNDGAIDICDFQAATTAGFITCGIDVDDDAYLLRPHTTKVISFDVGSNAACKLLESAGE